MANIETKEVAYAHPVEGILNLPPGSTMIDTVVMSEDSEPIVEPVVYDDKDNEVDAQFQQVFEAAYTTFEAQRMSVEGMDPKFQARSLEVAAQFLNTALAAANAKASMKQNKDKLVKIGPAGSTTNNTTNIVMNRDDMLRHLLKQEKTIDSE